MKLKPSDIIEILEFSPRDAFYKEPHTYIGKRFKIYDYGEGSNLNPDCGIVAPGFWGLGICKEDKEETYFCAVKVKKVRTLNPKQ